MHIWKYNGILTVAAFLWLYLIALIDTYANVFTDERKAKAVLGKRRHRRDVAEECREGCSFEELRETGKNGLQALAYMTRYKCKSHVCPSGYNCTNVNYAYSHINNLVIACKELIRPTQQTSSDNSDAAKMTRLYPLTYTRQMQTSSSENSFSDSGSTRTLPVHDEQNTGRSAKLAVGIGIGVATLSLIAAVTAIVLFKKRRHVAKLEISSLRNRHPGHDNLYMQSYGGDEADQSAEANTYAIIDDSQLDESNVRTATQDTGEYAYASVPDLVAPQASENNYDYAYSHRYSAGATVDSKPDTLQSVQSQNENIPKSKNLPNGSTESIDNLYEPVSRW